MTPEEKERFYKQMADGFEKMKKSIEGLSEAMRKSQEVILASVQRQTLSHHVNNSCNECSDSAIGRPLKEIGITFSDN